MAGHGPWREGRGGFAWALQHLARFQDSDEDFAAAKTGGLRAADASGMRNYTNYTAVTLRFSELSPGRASSLSVSQSSSGFQSFKRLL